MANFYGIDAPTAGIAFGRAACRNNFTAMELLLKDGVDINERALHKFRGVDELRHTALTAAANAGLVRSVKFLIENGANLDIPGDNNMTALMQACSWGKVKGEKIAFFLMEAGANVKYIRQADEMTALNFAACRSRPEVLQALIDRGAEIDGPKDTKQTALMLAARDNNVEALKVLIKNGADTSLECKLPWANNSTALELAKLEKNRKAVKFLSEL
jgi:ankyrin repeat protein